MGPDLDSSSVSDGVDVLGVSGGVGKSWGQAADEWRALAPNVRKRLAAVRKWECWAWRRETRRSVGSLVAFARRGQVRRQRFENFEISKG
ncbi:hypothetical protein LX32DRAFT_271917 [Colletotrichum zoysiae]|uniref:Uncharacterized protein n=1 Tax=Colletotrichum zoysiae TaxID=1216348 RepID=A0AAD9H4F6_9PEZI|nr:hypothetical protein LX32DRAFT_271917 [Colletotrichum zoysiae]